MFTLTLLLRSAVASSDSFEITADGVEVISPSLMRREVRRQGAGLSLEEESGEFENSDDAHDATEEELWQEMLHSGVGAQPVTASTTRSEFATSSTPSTTRFYGAANVSLVPAWANMTDFKEAVRLAEEDVNKADRDFTQTSKEAEDLVFQAELASLDVKNSTDTLAKVSRVAQKDMRVIVKAAEQVDSTAEAAEDLWKKADLKTRISKWKGARLARLVALKKEVYDKKAIAEEAARQALINSTISSLSNTLKLDNATNAIVDVIDKLKKETTVAATTQTPAATTAASTASGPAPPVLAKSAARPAGITTKSPTIERKLAAQDTNVPTATASTTKSKSNPTVIIAVAASIILVVAVGSLIWFYFFQGRSEQQVPLKENSDLTTISSSAAAGSSTGI